LTFHCSHLTCFKSGFAEHVVCGQTGNGAVSRSSIGAGAVIFTLFVTQQKVLAAQGDFYYFIPFNDTGVLSDGLDFKAARIVLCCFLRSAKCPYLGISFSC
jgi:hypothetical protein